MGTTIDGAVGDGRTPGEHGRSAILHPVDRIMELLFGLLMALSFTGALSVAQAGRVEIREMFIAALGCNLAWGIVDAVMYLIRTTVDRAKSLTLLRSVRAAPDAAAGRVLIEDHLSAAVRELVSPTEVEAIRGRMVSQLEPPARAKLDGRDWLAALAIFLLVVLATFPVVMPFALMTDVGAAKNLSRVIALTMLFLAGFALGRYAGYGSLRAAFAMVVLGTLMVGVILALGG
jgi:hypothetical protein